MPELGPIRVIAHPDRRDMAEKLAETVSAAVCWDDGTHPGDSVAGCSATHISALNSLRGQPGEWFTLLEDDAVPVELFTHHLGLALRHAPAPIVGLYLGTGNPSGEAQRQIRQAVVTAQNTRTAWLLADCLIGSVGYALRTDILDDLTDFITDRDEELPLRISRWAQHRDVAICYTMPSLLNHDDGVSIGGTWRGPHYRGRKAWWHGTRNNWNTDTVTLGHCPIWSKEK